MAIDDASNAVNNRGYLPWIVYLIIGGTLGANDLGPFDGWPFWIILLCCAGLEILAYMRGKQDQE